MKKTMFLLCPLFFFYSCLSLPTYNWHYSLVEPVASDTLAYSDESIDVLFTIREKEIGFDIQNKTDSGIRINWDELSLVYPDGTSSRVIHSGIRLMDRNIPQAPTVIPPNAKVSDILIPSENIFYVSSLGWLYAPLFRGDNKLIWDGQEFSVYFPLEIKGAILEYSFKFLIKVSQPPAVKK